MIHHPIVWLRRLRYRKGYGIHSPFAFRFVTEVIYETDSYYIYEEIENRLTGNWWQRAVQRKLERLSFRLDNYAKEHPEDGMTIVHNLQNNLDRWEVMKKDENIRVTFDLYDVGVVFTNPKLQKQDYIINF